MKWCARCGNWKEETEYYHSAKTQDGLRLPCKDCCSVDNKQYGDKNRKSIKIKWKEWYQNNREKVIEKAKKYSLENRDKKNLWAANFRAKNPEKIKAWHKEYEKNHPEQVRAKNINYKTKKKSSGKVLAKEWHKLLQKYDNKCLKCGRSDVVIEMDHVIPIAKGGLNVIENIQPLCRSCNARKHTKIIDYRTGVTI